MSRYLTEDEWKRMMRNDPAYVYRRLRDLEKQLSETQIRLGRAMDRARDLGKKDAPQETPVKTE